MLLQLASGSSCLRVLMEMGPISGFRMGPDLEIFDVPKG